MALHPTEAIQQTEPAPGALRASRTTERSSEALARQVAEETHLHVDAEHRRCAYEEALRAAERQWMLDSPETR
jgi:hypothetical protein